MKIIISPAKNFKQIDHIKTSPLIFKEESKYLVNFFKDKSMSEIGNIFKLNDDLTEKVYYAYQDFDFKEMNSPAIFTYDGLVYKQFSIDDFEDLEYLNQKVYILSALYGALKPLTGIRPYRLDMMIKEINMYDFWEDKVKNEVFKEDKLVLNLASKEYAKLLWPFLNKDQSMVTVDFKDYKNGKLRTVVAWAKQMRGLMLKYIVQNKIEAIDKIKQIELEGYSYDSKLSKDDNIVFVRRES
ncbi:MAG: YaaA family protein [Peptoniphilaceae bacterium]|nr:YaaA family protein [Peptoniphilaceae bacterium]MDY6019242.1 YaaA family protein [Anaerococcus sp.]